jgi:cysteine dioxygenase
MSTETNLDPAAATQAYRSQGARFGLGALVATIRAQDEVPSLESISRWIQDLDVDNDEIRPYISFKPATYARHLVVRGTHAEVLILCWRPGQKTPIHDHNGSVGAVKVCRGLMWETVFTLDETNVLRYSSGRDWNAGAITGAGVPDIHQLGNPDVSGQDLVTIHIYAPPLGVLNTYKVGTTEVGHYSPNDFMDGAGI